MKCRFPVLLTVKGRQIYVPCGHCAWCLKRIRDEWFVRLKYEGSKALFRSFCTFTYRDEDLPFEINEETGELVPSVSIRDVQLFHKRCRKDLNFRFMLCSEYGPKTGRPHYHAVYFHNTPYNFASHWPYGDNNSQYPAKDGSYKYICKYILKGSNVPECAASNFRVMSRRPGLGDGANYDPDQHFWLLENGAKAFIPRYYKKKYLARLDEQLRSVYQDKTLDYLHQLPQHDQFHKVYDRKLQDGSFDPSYSFEQWLYDLYGRDFNKQVQINSK